MSMLLHCCCGPCAMYPVDLLLKEGRDIELFWYNPNIHPQFEWERRLENLGKVADHYHLKLITEGDTCEEDYWKSEVYLKDYPTRCDMCYDRRLDFIAKYAADNGFDSFCTTLLVSPYQQHDKIASIASDKAGKYAVTFEYIDFRHGFREGQNMAREIGLYRQKYCGCIFSLESSKFRDKIYKSFEK